MAEAVLSTKQKWITFYAKKNCLNLIVIIFKKKKRRENDLGLEIDLKEMINHKI